MNWLKMINKYVIPTVIFILLLAFFIWAIIIDKEGFKNSCDCPSGSQLRNGGCYSCENEYNLSDDYYNVHCVSKNPNDFNTPRYIKSAKIIKVDC